ncbi:MAG: hypothetical protein U5M50_10545 [Sphingobium sp.]|nr:hypothetical protein [Sphingobium sp.]
MACQRVQLPGGAAAIVCGPRQPVRRCSCGAPAPLLCDWKVPGRNSGTCDRPVCESCATSPAPDKDLCVEHAAAWIRWQQARGLQA